MTHAFDTNLVGLYRETVGDISGDTNGFNNILVSKLSFVFSRYWNVAKGSEMNRIPDCDRLEFAPLLSSKSNFRVILRGYRCFSGRRCGRRCIGCREPPRIPGKVVPCGSTGGRRNGSP